MADPTSGSDAHEHDLFYRLLSSHDEVLKVSEDFLVSLITDEDWSFIIKLSAYLDASLAVAIEPPWAFAELRRPGVPLLVELIDVCRARPGITTGALLERYAGREEANALQKLAVAEFPGGDAAAADEFLGAIRQLERQTRAQRRLQLQEKRGEGLTDEEADELRRLLALKEAPAA